MKTRFETKTKDFNKGANRNGWTPAGLSLKLRNRDVLRNRCNDKAVN